MELDISQDSTIQRKFLMLDEVLLLGISFLKKLIPKRFITKWNHLLYFIL